eukprot:9485379-Pyramimonas_sp.AAC.1
MHNAIFRCAFAESFVFKDMFSCRSGCCRYQSTFDGQGAGPVVWCRMLNDEVGRKILAERPRIVQSTVAHCWDLPQSTFGGAYAQFMGERGFSADDRPPVRFVDDPELAFVAARAREVHDFWHVLFGLNTSVLGEAALKVLGLDTDTVELTVKTLLSHLVTREFKFSINVLRTSYVRVEPCLKVPQPLRSLIH